jgi:DNA-binding CsgD family transcriptional regulator
VLNHGDALVPRTGANRFPLDRDARCTSSQVLEGQYRAACAGHRAFRLDYRISTADGSYHQVEQSGYLWFESSGRPGGYVGQLTVVGESEERIRAAVRDLAILSTRERSVLTFIAHGYATKEVAHQLGISHKTAGSHRSSILKKLGLHETASLVRFAVRAGWSGSDIGPALGRFSRDRALIRRLPDLAEILNSPGCWLWSTGCWSWSKYP